jgi:hypothetical protein
MQKDTVLSIGGNGTQNAYVKNSQMPGAYTSRPDKVVSLNPDFGCGVQVASYLDCLESVINLQDRVNGNTTTANLAAATGGNGQNTAPTSMNSTGGGGPSGLLVGDLTSEVYLDSIQDGMPSGSIVFHRTDGGAAGPINVDFDQTVSFEISGFQNFTEHDYTLAPFASLLCGTVAVPVNNCSSATPIPNGGVQGSRHSGVAGGFPMSNLGIRAELSLSQPSMGGEGTGTEEVAYSVDWTGNGMYPTPGAYFTPGLNVGDWSGSPAADTSGF